MRWILLAEAIEPTATGLVLIISPTLFGWLVFGGELSEPGQALGRLAGIVMLSLGFACWPAPVSEGPSVTAVRALLIYNLFATIYLCYLGIDGKVVGLLLWPAVVLHVILAIFIIRVWLVADGLHPNRRMT